MPDNEDLTQDQGARSGRHPQPDDDVEERLAGLEATAKAQKETIDRLTEGIGKRDELIRQHQSRADRLSIRLNALQQSRSSRPQRGTRGQQTQDDDELVIAQADAHASSMEATKYRLMKEHSLEEADLPEGLNLAEMSQGELRLHIELAATNKQLRELGASPASRQQERPGAEEEDEGAESSPPSPAAARGAGGLFDTGGPTGEEARNRLARMDGLYKQAEQLKDQGAREQGAYLHLRTVHQDPRKVVRGPEPEDELDALEQIPPPK